MFDPEDIHPLTEFQRNAKAHIKRLRKTGRAEVLTVNGKAALVIQDAASYRKKQAAESRAAEVDAILAAIKQADAGLGRSFAEFDREFRARVSSRRKARRRSA